jgi:hypothetical protein
MLNHTLFPGKDSRLGTIRQVQLAQDITDVAFHCLVTNT